MSDQEKINRITRQIAQEIEMCKRCMVAGDKERAREHLRIKKSLENDLVILQTQRPTPTVEESKEDPVSKTSEAQ